MQFSKFTWISHNRDKKHWKLITIWYNQGEEVTCVVDLVKMVCYNVSRKFTADQYAVYKWLGRTFAADQYAGYKWLGRK